MSSCEICIKADMGSANWKLRYHFSHLLHSEPKGRRHALVVWSAVGVLVMGLHLEICVVRQFCQM